MTALAVAVVVGVVVAVVAHEAGHALAAVLLGARTVRLRLRWAVVRVEADVPEDRWRLAVFLLAGAVANVAVAVAAFAGGAVVEGVVGVAFAVVNLLPHSDSDGERLLALARTRRPDADDGDGTVRTSDAQPPGRSR
jgi:hypothetical protein